MNVVEIFNAERTMNEGLLFKGVCTTCFATENGESKTAHMFRQWQWRNVHGMLTATSAQLAVPMRTYQAYFANAVG